MPGLFISRLLARSLIEDSRSLGISARHRQCSSHLKVQSIHGTSIVQRAPTSRPVMATSTPGNCRMNPITVCETNPNLFCSIPVSLFGSRVFLMFHRPGATTKARLRAHSMRIGSSSLPDKNTPALGAHEPADAREAGYWAARLSDFEANRGPWPLLLVTQLAALHDA